MFFKLTYITGLFQKKASLPHQHDLLQTQLQTHAGIMMMLDLKFGAHCYKLTLQTKPAGNQPSFWFMSSGNPDTL